MRRLAAVFAAVVLSLAALGFAANQNRISEVVDQPPESGGRAAPVASAAGTADGRPNILLIMTDDLDERTMENFPELQREVGAGGGLGSGATFENSYVTHSLCCPSRASMLTGMYSHNHRVRGNKAPVGGVEAFEREGNESRTVAARLDEGGYRTVFIGKYMNGYDGGYVPEGWDRWYGYQGFYTQEELQLFENEREVLYDPDRRLDTYVMRNRAIEEIRASGNRPFFMWLSFNAPHGPAPSPEKYADDFRGARVPRVPSMEEEGLDDKPQWVRQHAGKGPEDKKHRLRLRSMLPVSESVSEVIQALAQTGELANTYIVFTSDNGLRLGEHGIEGGKKTAYEEDISVPLYVRGPGIPAGAVYDQLALNTDLAPTFTDWANVNPLPRADGRSLAPIFEDPNLPWRTAFLVEHWRDKKAAASYIPTYKAVHTRDAVYIRHATGETEMYELDDDPYQLDGTVQDVSLAETLQKRLSRLEDCARQECRAAEDGR